MNTEPKYGRKLFVIDVEASPSAYAIIDTRLPGEVVRVKGFMFSIAHISSLLGGIVSLQFSEGISKSLLNQVVRPLLNFPRKKVAFVKLDEPVSENCRLQGYFLDTTSPLAFANYNLKIYLDCEVRE